MLKIGRLHKHEAIQLVGQVLGQGNLMPNAADAGESEAEIDALVEAVGCHARSLVLIAGEVAATGVRRATEQIREVMKKLEKKHPGDRERSLIASAELSLRRLPAETRRKIRPLSVFHGGAWGPTIGVALRLEPNEAKSLARELESVGIAEIGEFGYVRFDPALLRELEGEEFIAARAAWAEAMAREVSFLSQEQFKNAPFAYNLAALDLPNLLAALEHLAGTESPERVIDLATRFESLLANLDRAKALARVIDIRAQATAGTSGWGHAQFEAHRAVIERLIEQSRDGEAVQAARLLLKMVKGAGENAYKFAAIDHALAHATLGRALYMSGLCEEALMQSDEAVRRFEGLREAANANSALSALDAASRDS